MFILVLSLFLVDELNLAMVCSPLLSRQLDTGIRSVSAHFRKYLLHGCQIRLDISERETSDEILIFVEQLEYWVRLRSPYRGA